VMKHHAMRVRALGVTTHVRQSTLFVIASALRRTATFFLTIALLLASAIKAQVPDTPAGRQLSAWLNAINSGDRATMQQFIDKSLPGRPVEPTLARSKQTGGYDVRKVEESSDTRIVVVAQERADTKPSVRITVRVAADAPDRIAGIQIGPAQPP